MDVSPTSKFNFLIQILDEIFETFFGLLFFLPILTKHAFVIEMENILRTT
jgi:hypothetical protein